MRKNQSEQILDCAETTMGSRMLSRWLALPLKNTNQINERLDIVCLLYTSPSPRDRTRSRMPSSA